VEIGDTIDESGPVPWLDGDARCLCGRRVLFDENGDVRKHRQGQPRSTTRNVAEKEGCKVPEIIQRAIKAGNVVSE
jgi:hypothetical protein